METFLPFLPVEGFLPNLIMIGIMIWGASYFIKMYSNDNTKESNDDSIDFWETGLGIFLGLSWVFVVIIFVILVILDISGYDIKNGHFVLSSLIAIIISFFLSAIISKK